MIHVTDLDRELRKVHSTLVLVDKHLSHKDHMNAALHMSSDVRSTPLSSVVKRDLDALERVLETLSSGVDNTPS